MRTPLFILILALVASGAAFGQDKPAPPPTAREDFYTTTKELRETYQKVNASILFVLIDPHAYNGPHAGPGFVVGYDGPLITIEWISPRETNERISRRIPFRAITFIDKPIDRKGNLDYSVVYYVGPWGQTEFALLPNSGDIPDKIIARWKSYLLSQEPVR